MFRFTLQNNIILMKRNEKIVSIGVKIVPILQKSRISVQFLHVFAFLYHLSSFHFNTIVHLIIPLCVQSNTAVSPLFNPSFSTLSSTFHRICIEFATKEERRNSGVALGSHWSSTGLTLESHWSSTGVSILFQ